MQIFQAGRTLLRALRSDEVGLLTREVAGSITMVSFPGQFSDHNCCLSGIKSSAAPLSLAKQVVLNLTTMRRAD